jgi:hypothetical protein
MNRLLPVTLLTCGLLMACETTTGPTPERSPLRVGSGASLVSADVVMTVLNGDGELYSWGDGWLGTLGQGDLADRSTPTRIPGLGPVIHYAQSDGMAFALAEDGSLYQWGRYGLSSISPNAILVPTNAGRVPGGVSLHAIGWTLYIVDQQGGLWQMEPNHVDPTANPAPVRVAESKPVVQVSGGLGLYEDGTLFSLGDLAPEDGGLVEGLTGISSVQNSFHSTVALAEDGTVWAWGHDQECGLGDGVHLASDRPIQVPGLTGITKISASYGYRFALGEDGTVWHWGIREATGPRQYVCQPTPTRVPGVADAVDVDGYWEALILTANGELLVLDPATYELTAVPGG